MENKNFRDLVLDTFKIMVPENKVFSRMGSHYDGGYVVINDFSESDYLISFGIADNVDFENSMSQLVSGMDLYDYSIDHVPQHLNKYTFYKERVGANNDHIFNRAPSNKDLILKIDIEGSEWSFFESLSDEKINRFRQIMLEIHWGIENDEIFSPDIRLDVLNKINKTHQIIAIHPNNYAGIVSINGVFLPQVIELTFLRKSDYTFIDGNPPENLFYPNNPKSKELKFDIDNNTKEVFDKYLGELIFPFYDQVISESIKAHGVWEPDEFNWVIENIKEGDTCINVGSNVGYFTCIMSKKVGKNGKVFSIEANPNFKFFLEENVKRTNMDNVSIIMSAAGNYSGNIDLFINSDNCGDNRVFNPKIVSSSSEDKFSESSYAISVSIDKVDNLVTTDKVDFVLIDCQGLDHEVIRGMSKIIKENHPKILTEFVPKWIDSLGESPENILEEYVNLGYDLLSPELHIHSPVSPKEMINAIEKSGKWFINIFLKPKDIK